MLLLSGCAAGAFSNASGFRDHPGAAIAGIAAGLGLAAAALAVFVWSDGASRRAATKDAAHLRARGLDDGLPMGAFRRGDRIGLEGADLWVLFGGLAALFGTFFLMDGLMEPEVGLDGAIPIPMFFFALAALCLRLGTGLRYWLGPDGLETARWPRRSIAWRDVVRVVPRRMSESLPSFERAYQIELQRVLPDGWSWRSPQFTVYSRFLETPPASIGKLIEGHVERAVASGDAATQGP